MLLPPSQGVGSERRVVIVQLHTLATLFPMPLHRIHPACLPCVIRQLNKADLARGLVITELITLVTIYYALHKILVHADELT